MLKIYQSNLTEQLLSTLCAIVSRRPQAMSVFQPEQILVQNPDMAQWLKMELAEQHGVAANLTFPLPSAFLWQVFKALFPDLPAESPFSKERIVWQLMQLLPEFMAREEFSWVESYLSGSEGDERNWRLYQLCGGIADIFDQYLMYRPDWVANWEEGETGSEVPPEHQWQPLLWQAVANAIQQASGTRMHRGRLLQQAIERLDSDESVNLKGLPPRICLFGISALPEQTLLLLNGLGNHLDLHWFQLNPCSEFWLDIIDSKSKARLEASQKYQHLDDLTEDRYFLVGNPLLASMGGLGREHLSLMYERLQSELHEEYPGFPAVGALGVLQTEINQLSCRGQFDPLTPEQLNSNQGKLILKDEHLSNLQLHACYSPMREVEVLKDQLLHLFDQHPQLAPNDIMVMMPDVAAYAPFIHAVFSGVDQSQRFPYSINDLSAVQESPLIDSMLTLLDLPESRLRISEVLNILEVPAVMRRFAIDTAELEQIKHWLSEVGIRWGRDSEHRSSLGVGAFDENSWAFGLRRMLLGYAIHPDQGIFDSSMPYLEIEGADANALGKLMMFIDCLDSYRSGLNQSLPADKWPAFFAEFFDTFYQPDDIELAMLQRASSLITRLSEHCQQVDYQEDLPRLIVRDHLSQNLNAAMAGRRFRAGAVNFCTLMPMRSIPFKVIALLGMNDGSFPRNNEPVSFDLMSAQRRRGDRSRRLDDRYLFLEALLSCREHLHISWVGRDIRDDSELPPSILISELTDYMGEAWMLCEDENNSAEDAAANIVRKMRTDHRLQPFNPGYFNAESDLFSYSTFWADSLNSDEQRSEFMPDTLADPQMPEQLELRQLESMLLNPCAAFMQRQLGVYFDPIEASAGDSEPFELNGLEHWKLKDQALALRLNQQSLQPFKQYHRMTGNLPVGVAGDFLIDKAASASDSLIDCLPPYLPESTVSDEVRLRIGPTLLTGSIAPALNGRRWQIKNGSLKDKDRMRGWLRHLVACASGRQDEYFLIDHSHGICYRAIEPDLAMQRLQECLEAFAKGMQRPLALFLQTGFKLSTLEKSAGIDDELRQKLNKIWSDSESELGGEGDDPYIKRCYPDWYPNLSELWHWSHQLLRPLVEAQRSFKAHRGMSSKPTHKALFKALEAEDE